MAHQLLTTAYGLDNPMLHRLHTTGGAIKDLYRAEAGGRAYVFKRYRPDYRSCTDLTALADMQSHLLRSGFPVPAILPDREGRPVHEADGSCWVLYDWAPGRHLKAGQVTRREAAVLGEFLGQVALCLQDWRTDWAGCEPFHAYPPAEGRALFEDLLHRAEQGRAPEDKACVRALRQGLRGLEAMAGLAPRILAMEFQWVHGDPNEGNFFFDQEQVTGLIDFDNARRAPRGFDFMYALNSFFPEASPARDEYARAYMRTVRPSAAELELYAPIWAYWRLCDIWPVNIRYLEPATFDPAWSLPEPEDWWERRLDATAEWLLRISEGAITR
ncbi:MAG TPA: phosphotransferase [Symbiobacteriaceae bacterium]|nr:phosphotransferase [Symbiobacteriaceae bacterium]